MFCTQCGTALPSEARFCSHCGVRVGEAAAAESSALAPTPLPPRRPSSAASSSSPSAWTPPPPPPSTVLFTPGGEPTPAFTQLARALFHALDQCYEPRGTGMLEGAKMQTFYHDIGGEIRLASVGYVDTVLPVYAAAIPCELVPGRAPADPALTARGFTQYLAHEACASPDILFRVLTRNIAQLRLPCTVRRDELPPFADPRAAARQQAFETQLAAVLRTRIAQGTLDPLALQQDMARQLQSSSHGGGGNGGGGSTQPVANAQAAMDDAELRTYHASMNLRRLHAMQMTVIRNMGGGPSGGWQYY